MKENKKDIFLIVLFFSILIIPSIVYIFLSDKMDQTNYENRVLSTFDIVLNSNISNFSTNFEIYYNDHLPFKNELQKIRAAIKYNFFKTPANEKVIIGKNGWLFYNSGVDGFTDEVGDYRKTTRFTEEEYKLIYENLNFVKRKLKNKKIDFSLMIPSNKSSVYAEYMPSIYDRNDATTLNKTDDLVNKIQQNTEINIIYPKNKLIEYKKLGNTYYQYDTHWNDLGGFIGTMELIKSIEKEKYNILDYKVTEYNSNFGDLALMNQTLSFANSKEPKVNGYYDDFNPNCTHNEDVIECFESKAKYNKTLLLIGDSFRTAMVSHLSKSYKHVVIVYVPMFNYSYIEKYKPDTVVYEVVERNTYQLFTLKDSFN